MLFFKQIDYFLVIVSNSEQERLRDEARSKEKERVRKEEQRAEEEKVRTEMQIREAEENKKLEAMVSPVSPFHAACRV